MCGYIYSTPASDTAEYQINIPWAFLKVKPVLKHLHKQLALGDEEFGSRECAETLIRCDEKQNARPAKENGDVCI